jgi:hypothetical protein
MLEITANVMSGAIEGVVAYFLVKKKKWPCRGPLHAAIASAAATGITHPYAFPAFNDLLPIWGFWAAFFFVEVLVVLAEGLLIYWMAAMQLKHAMLQSLIANSASAFSPFVIAIPLAIYKLSTH